LLSDILVEADARVNCCAKNIGLNGFDVNASTWSDSHIWGVSVGWIAVDKKLVDNFGLGGRIQLNNYSFTKEHPGFRLHQSQGSRELCEHIKYVKNFKSIPIIVTFLTGFDIDVEKERDLRVNLIPQNITGSGFELKLGTWNNTKIFQTTGSCFSYGESEYIIPIVQPTVVNSPSSSIQTNINNSHVLKKQKTDNSSIVTQFDKADTEKKKENSTDTSPKKKEEKKKKEF